MQNKIGQTIKLMALSVLIAGCQNMWDNKTSEHNAHHAQTAHHNHMDEKKHDVTDHKHKAKKHTAKKHSKVKAHVDTNQQNQETKPKENHTVPRGEAASIALPDTKIMQNETAVTRNAAGQARNVHDSVPYTHQVGK